jgi:hypothetical protein
MQRPFVLALAFLVAGLFNVACSRPASPASHANPQLGGSGEQKKISSSAPLPPLFCPPAGLPPLSHARPGTGHHRVTLAWNASESSSQPGKDVAGYCLYRSTERLAAKKNPTCSKCERVSVKPIASVSCVDDVVKDNTTYYYVAAAINRKGMISSASNEIVAVIPPSSQSSSISPVSSPQTPPLCRATSAAR